MEGRDKGGWECANALGECRGVQDSRRELSVTANVGEPEGRDHLG